MKFILQTKDKTTVNKENLSSFSHFGSLKLKYAHPNCFIHNPLANLNTSTGIKSELSV